MRKNKDNFCIRNMRSPASHKSNSKVITNYINDHKSYIVHHKIWLGRNFYAGFPYARQPIL